MDTLSHFDVQALRIGYYSDKYFLRTRDILITDNYESTVHYQYFPRKDIVLSGIPFVIEIFEKCTGYFKDINKADEKFDLLKILQPRSIDSDEYKDLIICLDELWVNKFDSIEMYVKSDGNTAKDMEPVIGIIGNPKYFAHLETATLGVLAECSAVSTSVNRVIKKLKSEQKLMFFPARFKHYSLQEHHGYAAQVGGVELMSTDANGKYTNSNGIGTIPHLLIAAYGGYTPIAAMKFDDVISPDVDRTVLVDWDNNCIRTSIEVVLAFTWAYENITVRYSDDLKQIKHFSLPTLKDLLRLKKDIIKNIIGRGKGKLFGVRFDTSGSLIDSYVSKSKDNFGVCPELIFKAREEFDSLGLNDLKIIVSGGFTEDKIDLFQKMNAPVDVFGIGSSIVNNFHCDFTADAVTLDGRPNAKVGRHLLDWANLNPIY